MRASKSQEQAWTQLGKATRKFNGKVYQIVSDGWDTKSHALQSMPDEWIKDHYIRFTIDYRDMYTMWARNKPIRSANPSKRKSNTGRKVKASYMGTILAIGTMVGIAYLAKRSKEA